MPKNKLGKINYLKSTGMSIFQTTCFLYGMNIALPHKRLSCGEMANLMVTMNAIDAMAVVFITFSQLWVLVVALVSSVMVREKFNLGYILKKK